MTREPVALGAAIVVLVQAILAGVLAFGVDVTPEQTAAILGIVTAVIAVLVALGVRSLVTPVHEPRHAAGSGQP